MSVECSECERDLRGGHDPECSRFKSIARRQGILEAAAKCGGWADTWDGQNDAQVALYAAQRMLEVLAQDGPSPPAGCLSCGISGDGGYEVEDGPGPFCSSCWLKLEEHFGACRDENAPRRCESCLPDCGPATCTDVEGVPLCDRCAREMEADLTCHAATCQCPLCGPKRAQAAKEVQPMSFYADPSPEEVRRREEVAKAIQEAKALFREPVRIDCIDQAARILELEALLSKVGEHLPYHERSHPDWTPLSDLGREVRTTLRGETTDVE